MTLFHICDHCNSVDEDDNQEYISCVICDALLCERCQVYGEFSGDVSCSYCLSTMLEDEDFIEDLVYGKI